MLRVDAAAALALPPISSLQVLSDGDGWTVTERRPPVGPRREGQKGSPSAKTRAASVHNGPLHWEKGDTIHVPGIRARSPKSARAAYTLTDTVRSEAKTDIENEGQSGIGNSNEGAAQAPPLSGPVNMSNGPPPGHKPAAAGQSMKSKTITNWLNHTLGQATNKPEGGTAIASAAAKQAQGLAQFGIDSAALERLGLDHQAADRVYRAMFVYSQGMHTVLQEAVARSKNSTAALLVLWRAFQAVLEQAGQSDENGSESLADLVKRGNEEEKDRIEGQFRDQISALQGQVDKLSRERRAVQEELQRVKEDEMRLRNDSEMYRNEHEATEKKYESQIKLRGEAEVKYLDQLRHAENLQENLDASLAECLDLKINLKEEMYANAKAKQENETLVSQVNSLDSQVTALRQAAQEAALYKQRMDQQVGLLKQQMDRATAKTTELQDMLDLEQETNKRLQEQISTQQRECRRIEREYEDEQHFRKELESERNLLREKVDKLDQDVQRVVDEKRSLQKQHNELSLQYKTTQIELTRKVDQLERTEAMFEKLQVAHKELQEAHRSVNVEQENLKQEAAQLQAQCDTEAELRKSLQGEKKTLTAQVQSLESQLETSKLAVEQNQKELIEVTEDKVRLESIVRDTKSAMQKLTLEQQVENKAHAQKIAMLEKVIADERTERRNLVAETQEVTSKRNDSLEQLRLANQEIANLKRGRLEKDEDIERLKVLLKAQEQRNNEQLVTVDKYHAIVAAHEAEMRQMQVLLEGEREEAARQCAELQDSAAAAQLTLEQRVERWRFSYEDIRSKMAFHEASDEIGPLQREVQALKQQLAEAEERVQLAEGKAKVYEKEVKSKKASIDELMAKVQRIEFERDDWQGKFLAVLPDVERSNMLSEDAIHRYERIRRSTEVFEEVKASLERQLAEARIEILNLRNSMQRHMVDVSTQASIQNDESQTQTDLSYQYLEQADHMQGDRWRRDRLDNLKRASHFVDDPEERRDFTVQMRTTAPPIAQLGSGVVPNLGGRKSFASQQDMAASAQGFERYADSFPPYSRENEGQTSPLHSPRNAKTSGQQPVHWASAHVGTLDMKLSRSALVHARPQNKMASTSPAVPEPWPTARPPGAAPPPGSQNIQAMRRSYPPLSKEPSPRSLHISQVKTTARPGMPPQ